MIILSPSIKILEKDSKISVVEIEPLYPGYGTTIGNALRRVLLSSIEGAAITQVKISRIAGEFSTLPGIQEDILEITLNLKQVRLKVFGEEPQKIEIKTTGEKEIKAGDIKVPSQVEITNKNLHIASLTSPNAKLEMEMLVEKGFGYVSADQLKKGKSEIGVMYLDAIFTPIQRVAFWVENIRLEKRTDYNKLKIEIESDGTIKPKEALKGALEILVKHFEKISENIEEKKEEVEAQEKKVKEIIDLKDLKFSKRTLNALENIGIKSLNRLLKYKEEDIFKVKGLGKKGVEEIKKKLKKRGLELK